MCRVDKGFVQDDFGNCVCPPTTALNDNGDCAPCLTERGLKIDERGYCVCDLERGFIIDERGNCVCPTEYGYQVDIHGNCARTLEPECHEDSDCPDQRYCNKETEICDDPCNIKRCGVNALCNVTNHVAVCQCITGYTGNADVYCSKDQNHILNIKTYI